MASLAMSWPLLVAGSAAEEKCKLRAFPRPTGCAIHLRTRRIRQTVRGPLAIRYADDVYSRLPHSIHVCTLQVCQVWKKKGETKIGQRLASDALRSGLQVLRREAICCFYQFPIKTALSSTWLSQRRAIWRKCLIHYVWGYLCVFHDFPPCTACGNEIFSISFAFRLETVRQDSLTDGC